MIPERHKVDVLLWNSPLFLFFNNCTFCVVIVGKFED